MLDYVDSKERQGIFFEKPSEKIHLPEPAELALMDHSKYEVNERVEDSNNSFQRSQILRQRRAALCSHQGIQPDDQGEQLHDRF